MNSCDEQERGQGLAANTTHSSVGVLEEPTSATQPLLLATQPRELCRATSDLKEPEDTLRMPTGMTTDKKGEGRKQGEEEEVERVVEDGVPCDQGWAWMILLGM